MGILKMNQFSQVVEITEFSSAHAVLETCWKFRKVFIIKDVFFPVHCEKNLSFNNELARLQYLKLINAN